MELASVHKGLLSTSKSLVEVNSTKNAAFIAWNGMSFRDNNFCSSGINEDEEEPVSHSFVLNNTNTFINHQKNLTRQNQFNGQRKTLRLSADQCANIFPRDTLCAVNETTLTTEETDKARIRWHPRRD